MARTESGLRQRIRAAIRKAWPLALVVGQPATGLTGPGRHDLYVVVEGVYVGLEVKVTGHRTAPRRLEIQTQRIRETRRAGGCAWFVRSVEGALVAVECALNIRPKGRYMAEGDFDIDNLLAQLRAGDPPEQEVADKALLNGTAAGDGEALGVAQTPPEFLIAEMANLARVIHKLTDEIAQLRQLIEDRNLEPGISVVTDDTEPTPSVDDSIGAMLGLSTPAVPAESADPKPKRSRRRAQ